MRVPVCNGALAYRSLYPRLSKLLEHTDRIERRELFFLSRSVVDSKKSNKQVTDAVSFPKKKRFV